MPFEAFAMPEPPHGRPGTAIDLTIGQPVDHTLNKSQGITQNWYVTTATSDGIFNAATRSTVDDVDLVLEAYYEGDFENTVASSDQDLGGNTGTESIAIPVEMGQRIFVVVSLNTEYTESDAGALNYRLSNVIME
jgi:hypothetical protein